MLYKGLKGMALSLLLVFMLNTVMPFGRRLGAADIPASESGPRYRPDPGIAALASLPEPLSVDNMLLAAFIASGVPGEQCAPLVKKVHKLLESAPKKSKDPEKLSEELLVWMHENLLKNYSLHQTRLDVLLEKGGYNCVSSAVMYSILLKSRNIPVYGVQTFDHAFCRVPLESRGDGGVDVETTTHFGFDPGRRKKAADAFTGRTGFAYTAPGNYRERQKLGDKELVSLIYQNRLASLQRQRNWLKAVELARDRWALSGTEASRNDFRESLHNYAAAMNKSSRRIEALRFLNAAHGELGKDHGLEETASALLGNEITALTRQRKFNEAMALLENKELCALVPRKFVEERYREFQIDKVEHQVASAPFEEALTILDSARSRQLIDLKRWHELSMFIWTKEAKRVSGGGKWMAGVELLKRER